MYCTSCGEQMNDNQLICENCGAKAGYGRKFCSNCGSLYEPGEKICANCGVEMPLGSLAGQSKTLIALVCFFLGGLGIHNFLMGEIKKGVVKILTSFCCGVGLILNLVDFIRILTDTYVVNPDSYI